METRKLYKQGKSVVLVLPSKYLRSLSWSSQDYISISLLPDKTLKLTKVDTSTSSYSLSTPILTSNSGGTNVAD